MKVVHQVGKSGPKGQEAGKAANDPATAGELQPEITPV